MTAHVCTPAVELARYRFSAGERVVRAQRFCGVVRLSDVPGDPLSNDRRYIIERELTSMAELQAIVADYLQQAAIWDAIPARPCCFEHAEPETRS
jgi:hypothetical protein